MSKSGKIASFFLSLALIAWQVFDIVKGKAGVLTWVLLGVFSLGALFELGDICTTKDNAADNGTANKGSQNNSVQIDDEAGGQKLAA